MSCHERLQALTNSYKKELPLLESSMGFGMGFWKDPNWDLCQHSEVASFNGQSNIVDLLGLEHAHPALDPPHLVYHLKVQ